MNAAKFVVAIMLCAPSLAPAQHLSRAELTALADAHGLPALQHYAEFLRIPNDAHNYPDLQRNLAWVDSAFGARGFETESLPTGGFPLLLAQRPAEDASHTVLIYLQIDGQPVDSSKWQQDSPYTPTLKERSNGFWQAIPWERLHGDVDRNWRIFARSAADAKGPVNMFLAALDAFAAAGGRQSYNIKVIMDFEEELGSPYLPDAVKEHRDKLAADMLIIYDGPRHYTNQPTLTFGARGISTITLTVYGPRVPQHSGRFGNYIPNPALRLARLLASMKDDDGRVTIPGFYDGIVLDDATLRILAQTPDDETELHKLVGISETDKVGATLQEAVQYPSLNIRGMQSAWIGSKVRTIIPAAATAEIDVRLVPEANAERLIGLIRSHVQKQGYFLTNGPPTDAERAQHGKIASFRHRILYQAYRTPYDSQPGRWLTRAMNRAFGKDPIRFRMSGGSVPISPFITTLGLPAVNVPTVNMDNNQHSPNENLRVGNFIDGVRTFLAILDEPIDLAR